MTRSEYLAVSLGMQYHGSDIIVLVDERHPIMLRVHFEVKSKNYYGLEFGAGLEVPAIYTNPLVASSVLRLAEEILKEKS